MAYGYRSHIKQILYRAEAVLSSQKNRSSSSFLLSNSCKRHPSAPESASRVTSLASAVAVFAAITVTNANSSVPNLSRMSRNPSIRKTKRWDLGEMA